MTLPITVLATDLDVGALTEWIAAIPFTEWPAGSHVELRPCMVTDLSWRGFGTRTDDLVQHLLSLVPGAHIATCRWLSVVLPGHSIPAHCDGAEPGWICRVHVPLITNESAIMIANDMSFHLAMGTAYCFDKTSRHAVANVGDTPRVHLMFDAIGDP